jgi:hypothetical protein
VAEEERTCGARDGDMAGEDGLVPVVLDSLLHWRA